MLPVNPHSITAFCLIFFFFMTEMMVLVFYAVAVYLVLSKCK